LARSSTAVRKVAGAQTIDRACSLLKEIARHGAPGARLHDLTKNSGLSRPTVHRILQSLSSSDFVRQDPGSRRYQLAVGLFALGLAAPNPAERLPELRALLDALAAQTGDTAYLWMRQGDEVLCLARAEGAFPIRTFLYDPGAMRPIGATLAGSAMLASLDDEEVEAILARIAKALAGYRNATPLYVRRQIANVRRNGFCHSENLLIEGATGLSAPVPARDGAPYMAVSLSAICARIPKSRVKQLSATLLQTCARMSQVVARGARKA
jgi:DNA-binding IclR family transcriptional regulator